MSSPEQPTEPDADQPAEPDAEGREPISRREARSRAQRARGGVVGFLRETAIVLGTALVLSLLIKTFLFQAFYIPSESMEQTLMINDRVLVTLLDPGPLQLDRGDIVVFRDPGGWLNGGAPPPQQTGPAQTVRDVLSFIGVLPQDSGEHLIKRVIGLPGDHVVCCDADGKLTINGTAITEDYLPSGTAPSSRDFDIVVPNDGVWLMGDNREHSLDSRYHQNLKGGGSLQESYIVGRAFVLFWPLDRAGGLSNHSDVFAQVPEP